MKQTTTIEDVLREMRSEEWQGGDALPWVEKWANDIESALCRYPDCVVDTEEEYELCPRWATGECKGPKL